MENFVKPTELEQFAAELLDHSTRYNNLDITSYSPYNIIGKCRRYPSYGGFPDTYILRTYGKWWKMTECNYQKHYMPHDVDPFGAEDYFTLFFNQPVIPKRIYIYETNCPGSVVRISGRIEDEDWSLLWEGAPQSCPAEPRKFDPPIRQINRFVNQLRIEINCSELENFTAFDAVLLSGYPTNKSSFAIGCYNAFNFKKIENHITSEICGENRDLIDILPYEIIIHIFQYLDLQSLSRCARVNKRWNQITHDPMLYKNLSLKKYWYMVNNEALLYFMKRCKHTKKLDLSWCGELGVFWNTVLDFLEMCSKTLTHLSLCNCAFATEAVVYYIPFMDNLKEIRLKNVPSSTFSPLRSLKKLVIVDLSNTQVQNEELVIILKNNSNLKHLNLDFCTKLRDLDEIVKTASLYNKKLIGWSSWQVSTLSADGVSFFGDLPCLEDLDLGWNLPISPGYSLDKIAFGCKKLKRIILSGWRALIDPLIMPLIVNCKKLTQIDLLGVNGISEDLIEDALKNLPDLRLLELSFCQSISRQKIQQWRILYPQIVIQDAYHRGNNHVPDAPYD